MDPPGRPERTIGSIVATGTAGPLRHGFGPVRDHVLGCTVATGDGRLVKAGGRVVKNVAGYDLTKLQVGGFGGFGIIAEVHLRLRALPAADRHPARPRARATRSRCRGARRVEAQSGAGALELLSPALAAEAEWVLAARFVGTDAAVAGRVRPARPGDRARLGAAAARRTAAFWSLVARAASAARSRSGSACWSMAWTTRSTWSRSDLDEGLVSAGAGTGMIRWTGDAAAGAASRPPAPAAAREIPMTLERAPWAVRQAWGTSAPTARAWASWSAGCGTPSTRKLSVALEGRVNRRSGGMRRRIDRRGPAEPQMTSPRLHRARSLRPLRILPAACPTYLRHRRRGRQPARPDRAHARARAGRDRPRRSGPVQHLDACLGCRGCEPVCPSGVGYGRGLEAARELLAADRGLRPLAAAGARRIRHERSVASRCSPLTRRCSGNLGLADGARGQPGRIGFRPWACSAATRPVPDRPQGPRLAGAPTPFTRPRPRSRSSAAA